MYMLAWGSSVLMQFPFFSYPLPRFVPSQDDVAVFEALGKAPAGKYSHALRWYNHISSFGAEKSKFPGVKKALSNQAPAPAAADDDDDDEVDLFGSDEEEEVGSFVHLRIWSWVPGTMTIAISFILLCILAIMIRSLEVNLIAN